MIAESGAIIGEWLPDISLWFLWSSTAAEYLLTMYGNGRFLLGKGQSYIDNPYCKPVYRSYQ